MGAVYNVGVTE